MFVAITRMSLFQRLRFMLSGWGLGKWVTSVLLGLCLHNSLSRMQKFYLADKTDRQITLLIPFGGSTREINDKHWFGKKKSKLLAQKRLVMGSSRLPCKWIYDSVCPSNTASFVTCKWCVEKFVLFVSVLCCVGLLMDCVFVRCCLPEAVASSVVVARLCLCHLNVKSHAGLMEPLTAGLLWGICLLTAVHVSYLTHSAARMQNASPWKENSVCLIGSAVSYFRLDCNLCFNVTHLD